MYSNKEYVEAALKANDLNRLFKEALREIPQKQIAIQRIPNWIEEVCVRIGPNDLLCTFNQFLNNDDPVDYNLLDQEGNIKLKVKVAYGSNGDTVYINDHTAQEYLNDASLLDKLIECFGNVRKAETIYVMAEADSR